MISVQEASQIIFSHPWKPVIEYVDLDHSLGRVLAEVVIADRDFPPFNRVAMDGIAVRFTDLQRGVRRFQKSGIAVAGQPAVKHIHADSAVEVMTGAILPEGADAVIRYEDLRADDDFFTVLTNEFKAYQNVHRQGGDAQKGEALLTTGHRITAAEIPLLASVGCTRVGVYSLPTVAVVSTGDELVEPDQQPLIHQIRSSNGYALSAGLQELGIYCQRFHIGDQEEQLQNRIEKIINDFEVIILTGGVSKGKLDWVPGAMKIAGIEKHFHQVAQRPGKPLWFGTKNEKIVFALPGNPVSVFLCLYKYIRPWINHSLKIPDRQMSAVLEKDFSSEIPLTHFLQVRVLEENGARYATPVPGGGSGDFANLRLIDGFIELPPNAGKCLAGQAFPYIPIR